MAAVDLFETFIARMSEEARRTLAAEIATRRKDLLAARSEDARVRIGSGKAFLRRRPRVPAYFLTEMLPPPSGWSTPLS